jgi:hypothetical protein
MRNNFRDSILIGAVMTVCVMGNYPLAQATPSQTGPNISGMVSDSSVWTWPFGKAVLSKAANNGGKISEPKLEAKYRTRVPGRELLRLIVLGGLWRIPAGWVVLSLMGACH